MTYSRLQQSESSFSSRTKVDLSKSSKINSTIKIERSGTFWNGHFSVHQIGKFCDGGTHSCTLLHCLDYIGKIHKTEFQTQWCARSKSHSRERAVVSQEFLESNTSEPGHYNLWNLPPTSTLFLLNTTTIQHLL